MDSLQAAEDIIDQNDDEITCQEAGICPRLKRHSAVGSAKGKWKIINFCKNEHFYQKFLDKIVVWTKKKLPKI